MQFKKVHLSQDYQNFFFSSCTYPHHGQPASNLLPNHIMCLSLSCLETLLYKPSNPPSTSSEICQSTLMCDECNARLQGQSLASLFTGERKNKTGLRCKTAAKIDTSGGRRKLAMELSKGSGEKRDRGRSTPTWRISDYFTRQRCAGRAGKPCRGFALQLELLSK